MTLTHISPIRVIRSAIIIRVFSLFLLSLLYLLSACGYRIPEDDKYPDIPLFPDHVGSDKIEIVQLNLEEEELVGFQGFYSSSDKCAAITKNKEEVYFLNIFHEQNRVFRKEMPIPSYSLWVDSLDVVYYNFQYRLSGSDYSQIDVLPKLDVDSVYEAIYFQVIKEVYNDSTLSQTLEKKEWEKRAHQFHLQLVEGQKDFLHFEDLYAEKMLMRDKLSGNEMGISLPGYSYGAYNWQFFLQDEVITDRIAAKITSSTGCNSTALLNIWDRTVAGNSSTGNHFVFGFYPQFRNYYKVKIGADSLLFKTNEKAKKEIGTLCGHPDSRFFTWDTAKLYYLKASH